MPSLVTHHIFGKDVLDKIDNKYIDKDIYLLFNQSHDYLFHSLKKTYRILAKKAHHSNTKAFIINIIKYIKNNHLEKDKYCVSFLYGIINHYVLDSTCHPLIFYYGGSFHKEDKLTKKYRGIHAYIEKNIDLYMYEKYFKKKYKSAKLDKEFFMDTNITDAYDIINYAYQNTYDIDNTAKEFNKCVKIVKRFNRFIIRDKTSIKYYLYNLIDKITLNHFGVLSCYSTSLKKNDSFLNKNHDIWYHPVTGEKKDESFIDLYNLSIKKSLNIINAVNKVLYSNKDITYLNDYIHNIDYSHGLEIKKGIKMKYFKY